jgi:uncharacterized coiled-coil protein SlyX
MANTIVKGLAIAAGTGLAIGLGNNRKRPDVPAGSPAPEGAPSEADQLDQRLGRIESRLSAVEARPAPAANDVKMAEIEDRFDRQGQEIAALRTQMTETREKVSSVASVIESQFAGVSKQVPGIVDAVISSRVAELRRGLAAEIQASVDATLESFERTIDNKVAGRVAALEKALVDQSGIITALSQRAIESDANLQRLIAAVEKLCERSEPAQRPAQQPSAGFGPAIVKEEDDDRRPRHRLTRL